jgi:Photosystem I psaG / psaK
MVASTATFLAAGKFGLAPTVKRGTDAGCRLQDRPNAAGLLTGDPTGVILAAHCTGIKPLVCEHACRHCTLHVVIAFHRRCCFTAANGAAGGAAANAAVLSALCDAGFTAVDTLAFGALGHMVGVGVVLGLRATGGL